MQGFRHCWGSQSTNTFNVQWDIINHDSFVVITASEGREFMENGHLVLNTNSPSRFVGAARFTVDSISPHDGGVTFHVTIDWGGPLTLWTDIIVFDEISFSFG